MDEDVKAVESIIAMAYNQKPKRHKKTGKTRAETENMINQIVIDTQKKLIAYKCLRLAVLESKDSKAISDRAVELLTKELDKIGG